MRERFLNQTEVVTVIGDATRPTQQAELMDLYEDSETGEIGYYVHLLEEDEVDLVGPELIVHTDIDEREPGPRLGLGRGLGRGTGPGSDLEPRAGLRRPNRTYHPPRPPRYSPHRDVESISPRRHRHRNVDDLPFSPYRRANEELDFEPTGRTRGGKPRYTPADFGRAFEEKQIHPASMRALCKRDDLSEYYRDRYYKGRETVPISKRGPIATQSYLFKIADWKKGKESDKQAIKRIAGFMFEHAPKAMISEENLYIPKNRKFYHFVQQMSDEFLPQKGRSTKTFAPEASEGREILVRRAIRKDPDTKLPGEAKDLEYDPGIGRKLKKEIAAKAKKKKQKKKGP